MPETHVFIATSLDGFIAGPDDELDWLPQGGDIEDTFTPFMETVGALLMGRRTWEVFESFDVPSPYGETPILVATSRPLETDDPHVRPVSGTIEALVAEAKAVAGEKDVYVDGGALIRSALDAGLVDHLTLTVIPVVLGAGRPLFAGVNVRRSLELAGARPLGEGLVELTYRVG